MAATLDSVASSLRQLILDNESKNREVYEGLHDWTDYDINYAMIYILERRAETELGSSSAFYQVVEWVVINRPEELLDNQDRQDELTPLEAGLLNPVLPMKWLEYLY